MNCGDAPACPGIPIPSPYGESKVYALGGGGGGGLCWLPTDVGAVVADRWCEVVVPAADWCVEEPPVRDGWFGTPLEDVSEEKFGRMLTYVLNVACTTDFSRSRKTVGSDKVMSPTLNLWSRILRKILVK